MEVLFFDKAPKLYIKSLQCPFGVQARFTQRGRRPSLRMGWMGRNIKSVLQCSSYFVGIYIRYIPTYIDNKKLYPTFLCVSKFDVKLGVGVKFFKFMGGR